MSVCLSVCLCVCLLKDKKLTDWIDQLDYVTMSVCLSVCLSVCMSVCLSVCLTVWLSVCLSVCRSLCLSVCLSKWKRSIIHQYNISPCFSVRNSFSLCDGEGKFMIYTSPFLQIQELHDKFVCFELNKIWRKNSPIYCFMSAILESVEKMSQFIQLDSLNVVGKGNSFNINSFIII